MDSSSDLFQKIRACSTVNSDIIARLEAFDEKDVVVTSFRISKIALDLESEKSPTVTFPNAKTTKNICEQIKGWRASKPVSLSFPNFFRHELKREVSTFEDVKWAQSELKDLIEKYNMLREDQLIKFLGELRMILSKLEEAQVLLGEIESLTVSVKSPITEDSKKSEAGKFISKALECLDIDPSDSGSEWRLCRANKAIPSLPNDLEKFGDLSQFLNILIKSFNIDLNLAMAAATFIKRKDLVLFFIEKGADDWNLGLVNAAITGNLSLVLFFIEKGANNWNVAMCFAAEGGHIDLIEFFIGKGAYYFHVAIERAKMHNQPLAEEFLKKKQAERES